MSKSPALKAKKDGSIPEPGGQTIHLAGISGSLRKGSYNTMLLNAAGELLPQDVAMEILAIGDLPLYNGDFDLPTVQKRPAEVEKLREAVAAADGLVIASPEYNYSIPGGLKNAIDWLSQGPDAPLKGKPVMLMGASDGAWGTRQMQQAFVPIFQALGMKPVLEPEIMIAREEEIFGLNGVLADPKTRELVRRKLEKLVAVVRISDV